MISINSNNYTYPGNWGANDSVLQMQYEEEYHEGYFNVNFTLIGKKETIELSGRNLYEGADFTWNGLSAKVSSSKSSKIEVDRSKLAVAGKVYLSGGGSEDEPDLISQTWSCTMAQYELPLYRYCAPSALNGNLSAGSAPALTAWQNEPDPVKKSEFTFTDFSGNDIVLSGRTLDIAKKLNSGVEAVQQAMPVAQRVSVYKRFQHLNVRRDKLNKIDNTPEFQFQYGSQWLKTSFDWTENSDGTWTLTEGWTAAEYRWDPDLYSANDARRWQMYYPDDDSGDIPEVHIPVPGEIETGD